jgi:hypothetical protein
VTFIAVNSISLKSQLQIGKGYSDKYLAVQHPARLTVFRFFTLKRSLQTEGWGRLVGNSSDLELLVNERLLQYFLNNDGLIRHRPRLNINLYS